MYNPHKEPLNKITFFWGVMVIVSYMGELAHPSLVNILWLAGNLVGLLWYVWHPSTEVNDEE
jgi:hypothetical protein